MLNAKPSMNFIVRRKIRHFLENRLLRQKLSELIDEFNQRSDKDQKAWDFILNQLGVSANYTQQDLDRIPKSGPLIVVANHPYGLIDGVIGLKALAERRNNVKLLIHYRLAAFLKADDILIPVRMGGSHKATQKNRSTLREVFNHLNQDGAIFIFPAGLMSRPQSLLCRDVTDAPWKESAAAFAIKTGTPMLPMHFEGHNKGFLFHLAGCKREENIRMLLAFNEAKKMKGKSIPVKIGEPETFASNHNAAEVTEYMRQKVYGLAADFV